MRSSALALLILASPAIAAEEQSCHKLTEFQPPKDTTAASLPPAQYHFMQGIYAMLPDTPAGLPPGDSALLFKHEHQDSALLLWMAGPLWCFAQPIPKALLDLLDKVKGSGGSGDEL